MHVIPVLLGQDGRWRQEELWKQGCQLVWCAQQQTRQPISHKIEKVITTTQGCSLTSICALCGKSVPTILLPHMPSPFSFFANFNFLLNPQSRCLCSPVVGSLPTLCCSCISFLVSSVPTGVCCRGRMNLEGPRMM